MNRCRWCAILYADVMTDSMKRAIGETERWRGKQVAYNLQQRITPIGVEPHAQ